MEELLNEDVTDTENKEEQKGKKKKEPKPPAVEIYEWVEMLVISIALVFMIFSFVARVAVVSGNSMKPTLENGDKLLVRELFYTPKQGDIIVCHSEFYGFSEPLVKRVIATEGQKVRLDTENWKVYVDGVLLDEDYINYIPGVDMKGWDYGEEYTVPDGHIFVMGDNRNFSSDSRASYVGAIDERYVIGKVIFRFLPASAFGSVK